MKSYRILSLLMIALVVAPLVSAADFGLRAGRYNDAGDEFVGAEMVFDLGAVKINPNIEYSLADEVTAGTANVDFTLDLLNFARLTPYAGAGVGLAYTDVEGPGDTTDLVGNLIGGVAFRLDRLTPYAQIKYFRLLDEDDGGDDASDDIALTIGLRF